MKVLGVTENVMTLNSHPHHIQSWLLTLKCSKTGWLHFALLTENVCISKSFTYNWENDLSGHRVFSVPQGAFNDKTKLECALGDHPYIRQYGWVHCITMIYGTSALLGENVALLRSYSLILETQFGVANWKLSKCVASVS